MAQLYDLALAPSGLRSTQLAILDELHSMAADPPTMQELAFAMAMDRSTLGHNLQPLQRDGLVAVQEGKVDRRRRHVVLTVAGSAAHREAGKLWQTAQARFYAVVGESDAKALRAALLKLARNDRLTTLSD